MMNNAYTSCLTASAGTELLGTILEKYVIIFFSIRSLQPISLQQLTKYVNLSFNQISWIKLSFSVQNYPLLPLIMSSPCFSSSATDHSFKSAKDRWLGKLQS